MTIDDFPIQGISVSILISLASIAIAVIAVYYTCKQAKISHNQFELELKKVEKPRILEIIHNPLNTILHEMENELREIGETDLLWFIGSERNDLYSASLVFPISSKKGFHVGFHQLFIGPENIPSKKFSQIIGRVDEKLNKRYDIYRLIDQELSHIEEIIRREGLDQRINSLALKAENFSLKQNADKTYTIFNSDERGLTKRGTIPKKELDNIIVSMTISTLFKPLKIDEIRLGCLGYGSLTAELFPYIENSILVIPVPDADSVKKRVISHLADLKGIDENILADIDAMRKIYQKKYILTDAEMDPYKGTW